MPEAKLSQHAEVDDLAFLGREFMTWLLWRVDQGENTFGQDEDSFTLQFGSRVRLDALAGDVTTAALKGGPAAHSILSKAGIGAGCTLREAEMKATRLERDWYFTLQADTLDLKGAKLPELLAEEEDDRFLERMSLILELDSIVKYAYSEFLQERARPSWNRKVVPAIREWVAEALRVEAA